MHQQQLHQLEFARKMLEKVWGGIPTPFLHEAASPVVELAVFLSLAPSPAVPGFCLPLLSLPSSSHLS